MIGMLADNEQLPRLLLDCLHQDPDRVSAAQLAALTHDEWQSLLTLAGEQRVRGRLYRDLKARSLEQAVPPETLQSLRSAYWLTAQRNLVLFGELHRIVTALNALHIPVIALKGAFLATVVYQDLGLREMSDLDLLIAPHDLERAGAILEAHGYAPAFALSVPAAIARKHHLPRFTKRGAAEVEVHWNITQPEKAYTINPTGLWERARPVRVAGVEMLGLCPEDLILHLCQHISYHHVFAFGFRSLCDIAAVIDHYRDAMDWSQVLERARRWRWERGVYLALVLADELVGADVPADVLADLHPGDVDPSLVAAAASQLLTEPAMIDVAPASLARLWRGKGANGATGTILNSLFPPRKRMAVLFAVSEDSVRIFWCYFLRLKDMAAQNWRTVLALGRGDPKLGSMVERKAELLSWLDGKD